MFSHQKWSLKKMYSGRYIKNSRYKNSDAGPTKRSEINISQDGNTLLVTRNELVDSESGLKTARFSEGRNISKHRNMNSVKNNNWNRKKHWNQSERLSEGPATSHGKFSDLNCANNALDGRNNSQSNEVKCQSHHNKHFGTFQLFDESRFPGKNQHTAYQYAYQQNGQSVYQFIPPPCLAQQQQFYNNEVSMQSGVVATAIAPSGYMISIPIDHNMYEVRRDHPDLYAMPENADLRTFAPEDEFKTDAELVNSPRPIDLKGSLSNGSCASSEPIDYSTSESDSETETDESELAENCVREVLKSISNNVDDCAVPGIRDTSRTRTEQTLSNDVYVEATDSIKEMKTVKDSKCALECASIENFLKEKLNVVTDDKRVGQQNHEHMEEKKRISMKPNESIAKVDCIETSKPQCKNETGEIISELKEEDRIHCESIQQKKKSTMKKHRKAVIEDCCSKQLIENKGNIQNIDQDITKHEPENEIKEKVENEISSEHQEQAVVIDGQCNFLSQIEYNGQVFYIPNSYEILPQHLQHQVSYAPNHMMYINDACAPPEPDVEYSPQNMSLSGKSTDAKEYMPQAYADNGLSCSDEAGGNFTGLEAIASDRTKTNTDTTHCDSEHKSEFHTQQNPNVSGLWVTDCSQIQYYDGLVNDQLACTDGQLFVSYDENQVYFNPENGLPYPALHMTDDYLTSVILREGIFLEISADKSLRLVNHEKGLVVAINGNGDKTCVIHPAARIYTCDTSVHAELYLERRARLTNELVMFGNDFKTYKFDHRMVTEMTEEQNFRDMSQDDSVSFLSTDTPSDVNKEKMETILAHAYFWKQGMTGSTVKIYDTKVNQNDNGEVSVYSGPINFLRMNAEKNILRLKSRLVEINIESNWNIKITRGAHALNASRTVLVVSNGKIKGTLDVNNNVQAFSVADHRSLMLGQPVSMYRPGVPWGQRRYDPNRKQEPEGDHWGYPRHHQYQRNPVREQRASNRMYDRRFDPRNSPRIWDPEEGRWIRPGPPWQWRDYR